MSMLIAASGMFGTFLFLTYYLQQTLGYSPVTTVTVGQQLGASIGTSLLNTIFAGAVTAYLAVHAASAGSSGLRRSPGWP